MHVQSKGMGRVRAPFNNKGGLNIPYALPKAKNVTEHAVRAAVDLYSYLLLIYMMIAG